ncbi:hypothetical protein JTB14_006640 [Gonioctena quinquepunctata]|nr:hypothetical protein JTB14_006640 [Gonioctena quinquepunctata]
MINFKRARAKSRRIILSSKRSSWENYVASITSQTPYSEIWKKVKCIAGKQYSSVSSVLLVNDEEITDPSEIARKLAEQFRKNSSSENYSAEFQQRKANEEQNDNNFSENCNSTYNDPFTL